MKTIFKYKLEITDEQEIEMPDRAQVLSVAAQGDALCLWAMVDVAYPLVKKTVYIQGTGNPLTFSVAAYGSFVGTVVMPNGLVWHVFADDIIGCYSSDVESAVTLSENAMA